MFRGTDMLDDGESLAAAALDRFLGLLSTKTVSRVSEGMSGGVVYRCRTGDDTFALKQWPAGTTGQRVDEVHGVQKFAGKSLDLLPKLCCLGENISRLTLDSNHFELSNWLPGTSFSNEAAGNSDPFSVAAAVSGGAAAIAKFHEATQGLGVDSATAPAILQRLKRLESLRQELPAALASSSRLTGSARLAANYLMHNWQKLQVASEELLRPWTVQQVPLRWVLRDIHREHILFENGVAAGIVDFDAVRRDTVSTDLARWVGSFSDLGIDPESLWSEAFAGYASVRAISPCEQQLASAIEEASWYIHLANWVTWLADPSRCFPGGIAAAQSRVASLLRRSDVRISH